MEVDTGAGAIGLDSHAAGSELVAKARSVILLRSPREAATPPAGAATTIRG
jgi:hypothetical protein